MRSLADKVRSTFTAAVPATLSDGRKVMFVDIPTASASGGRDDEVQPPRYWSIVQLEFRTG
jgi:hypothetical protein